MDTGIGSSIVTLYYDTLLLFQVSEYLEIEVVVGCWMYVGREGEGCCCCVKCASRDF